MRNEKEFIGNVRVFPPNYCRNIDMMPILSLQTKLDKDAVVYFLKGFVTETTSRNPLGRQEIKTDLGVVIRPSDVARSIREVVFGHPDPLAGYEATHKEILKEIQDYEVIDCNINVRGRIHPIPENAEEIEAIQDAEKIYHLETKVGNRARSLRRKLNLPLMNPYRVIKAELLRHGIVKPYDKVLQRIKGITKTEYVLPDNGRGYDAMKPLELLELLRGIRGKTYGSGFGKKWWEDTARPRYISGRIDSHLIDARIYILDDRRGLIAI